MRDNIGNVDVEWRLAYAPIDVVYTWVNGSDPIWQRTKDKYRRLRTGRRLLYYDDYARMRAYYGDDHRGGYYDYEDDHGVVVDDDDDVIGEVESLVQRNTTTVGNITNATSVDTFGGNATMFNVTTNRTLTNQTQTNGTSVWNRTNATETKPEEEEEDPKKKKEEEKEEEKDDSASESRYRDSEEMRYSLRSLERFAPWIRRIFIVTDNQIPSWLNVDDPKVTIVPHTAIFEHQGDLPVFSSPAIEANLHRVPGVSKRFVYFNDDVLLGAPTWPDDFVTLDGAQRVYLAWDAPKCNEGCHDTWIGDGSCDVQCNVSSCDFDYPDCTPENVALQEQQGEDSKRRKGRSYYDRKRNPPRNKHVGAPKKAAPKARGRTTPKKPPPTKNSSIGVSALDTKKCAPACLRAWLGDGTCDQKCDDPRCLHDVGDCRGIDSLEIASVSFENGTNGTKIPVIDVPRGAPGVVVNVSGWLNDTFDVVHAYVEEEAPDAELVVYDAVFLSRTNLFVILIDGQRTTRVSVAQRAKRKDERANFTGFRFYYKEWSAGIVAVKPNVDDEVSLEEKTTKINMTFRLYDPTDPITENAQMLAAEARGPANATNITNTTAVPAAEMKKMPPMAVISAATCTKRGEPPDLTVGHEWSVILKNLTLSPNLTVVQRTSVVVEWSKGKTPSTVAYTITNPLEAVFVGDVQGGLELEVIAPRSGDDEVTGRPHHEDAAGRLVDLWRTASRNAEAKGKDVKHTLWVAGSVAVVKNGTNLACGAFAVEASDDWHLFDDDEVPANKKSIVEEPEDDDRTPLEDEHRRRRRRRRLLLDTYGESLARVNRLYSQRYGRADYGAARRVPAHMPHMIDTDVVRKMKAEWADEWRTTSRNRFRSGRDMQYAFAYFHYIMSKAKLAEPDFDTIWRDSVDTNGDGVLDGNEIITLASLVRGREPTDSDIADVYDCVVSKFSWSRWVNLKLGLLTRRRSRQFSHRRQQWDRASPYIATLKSTKACPDVVAGVASHMKRIEDRRDSKYIVQPNLNEVAFEMLGDDFNKTKEQLDSIRARQVKFICVNDNIDRMTPDLFGLLNDFFVSYYPKPSRFELPPGQRNAFLRYDDYLRHKFYHKLAVTFVALLFAALILSGLHARSAFSLVSSAEELPPEDDREKYE